MSNDIACQIGLLLFMGASINAIITDIKYMKISNELILVLLFGYLILMPLCGYPIGTIAGDGLISLCVLTVAFIVYMAGGIGAGDAKLISVTVLWLGADLMIPYIIYATALGGLLALSFLAIRRFPLPQALAGKEWATRLHHETNQMPYGVALGIAGLILLPQTHWANHLPFFYF